MKVEDGYTEGMLKGHVGGVTVTFASVPPGSPEIDALNSKENFMLSLENPAWSQVATSNRERKGESRDVPVDKVTLRQFRGRTKVRGRTGTPEQIISYVSNLIRFSLKGL